GRRNQLIKRKQRDARDRRGFVDRTGLRRRQNQNERRNVVERHEGQREKSAAGILPGGPQALGRHRALEDDARESVNGGEAEDRDENWRKTGQGNRRIGEGETGSSPQGRAVQEPARDEQGERQTTARLTDEGAHILDEVAGEHEDRTPGEGCKRGNLV